MGSGPSTAERTLGSTPRVGLVIAGVALVLAALWVTGVTILWRVLLDLAP